jgi:hypothetical protein
MFYDNQSARHIAANYLLLDYFTISSIFVCLVMDYGGLFFDVN